LAEGSLCPNGSRSGKTRISPADLLGTTEVRHEVKQHYQSQERQSGKTKDQANKPPGPLPKSRSRLVLFSLFSQSIKKPIENQNK
jgi:hypothetical protein